MTANRLIVFDCDGTLVDSQHNIVTAMTRAFRQHDLHDPVPEAVRRTVGLSILESVGRLLPDAPHHTLESIGEAYRTASYELRLEPGHEEAALPRHRGHDQRLGGYQCHSRGGHR